MEKLGIRSRKSIGKKPHTVSSGGAGRRDVNKKKKWGKVNLPE